MSAGTVLQVTGALFELGGLGTVAVGIAETRAKLTDQPALAQKVWRRVTRLTARVLRRRRSQTVHVGTATMHVSAGTVRARGTVGFGPWGDENLAERVERLRRAVESHEREISELHGRVDAEETTRTNADQEHGRQLEAARAELRDLIREAAAGGLRRETIGVSLFMFGVILQTWGNLIA